MPSPPETQPPVTEPLSSLLLRWQERRQQGQNPTAEEICWHCPELVEALKQQIEAIASMEAMLGPPKVTPADGPDRLLTPPRSEPGPVAGPSPVRDRWRIPGYELLEVLGEGGMSLAYKARQSGLHRLVAIKVLRAGLHARPEQLARFRTEAEALARLRHPNIVQVYEVGEHAGQAYLVMEFLEGGSLDQKLAKAVVPARQAAEWIAVLAEAVHAAHQCGIVHRDLKPGNILLAPAPAPRSELPPPNESTAASIHDLAVWTPKISDFGLAKWLPGAEGQPPAIGLTLSGVILGTPSYLAPEQAEGKSRAIGPAADIYALGAILYELLTGRPPFQGESTLDLLEQVRHQEPVPPSRLRPKVPRDLETICLQCLRKEPGKRYGGAAALADDLRRFLAGEPIRACPSALWERGFKWAKRKPVLAALVGVTAVAAATLLAGWVGFTAQLRAERDHARREQQRAETILDRSLTAIDRNAQVTRKAKELSHAQAEPGSLLYELARSYAAASALYRQDAELLAGDRDRLAGQYAARAVKLLANACVSGYFTHSQDNLIKLRRDKDLDPLRSRPDFQQLLAEVEGEAREN